MTTPSRTLTAALAGVLLTFGLVGCTGGTDDADPSPSASASPSPSASADEAPGITDITDTPGSGEGLVGALADSAVTTCEAADGGWTVAGTVTNPTDAPALYRIYVSLLDAAGGTRALTQVDVPDAEPAAATEWSTTIDLADEGLTCVLRVERYAA